ncbi:hypothetical protein V5799_008001 [Amblyomma americanum]|uniref:Uncharacterized protein n=1 Tax=Amblyomma americanum TaxID=6943 RepID=A0AAQ4FEC3_AMBAM
MVLLYLSQSRYSEASFRDRSHLLVGRVAEGETAGVPHQVPSTMRKPLHKVPAVFLVPTKRVNFDVFNSRRHEIYVVLMLGSYRRKIIESTAMLTRRASKFAYRVRSAKGDTLFSYLEGHIGMWLGLTLFSATDVVAGLYSAAAAFLQRSAGLTGGARGRTGK